MYIFCQVTANLWLSLDRQNHQIILLRTFKTVIVSFYFAFGIKSALLKFISKRNFVEKRYKNNSKKHCLYRTCVVFEF